MKLSTYFSALFHGWNVAYMFSNIKDYFNSQEKRYVDTLVVMDKTLNQSIVPNIFNKVNGIFWSVNIEMIIGDIIQSESELKTVMSSSYDIVIDLVDAENLDHIKPPPRGWPKEAHSMGLAQIGKQTTSNMVTNLQ